MVRNHQIHLKLSVDELERILRKAKEFEMSASEYIRLVALKSNIEVKTVLLK